LTPPQAIATAAVVAGFVLATFGSATGAMLGALLLVASAVWLGATLGEVE